MLKPFVASICVVLFLSMVAVSAEPARVERNGVVFLIYDVSPSRVDLFWLDRDGDRYRQFASLQKALAAESRRVEFMMNGGIFQVDGAPCGLAVIDGKIVHPLNTSAGSGNFYLKPNGVFYIDASGARILSTEEYASEKRAPHIAIQSGPLLLRQGRIHPAFRTDSVSYLHRNGVGIRKDGRVVFVITETGQKRYANLYEFADFFRFLGCDDALFLDGDVSEMVVNPKGEIPPGNNFGTIFAVAPKSERAGNQK